MIFSINSIQNISAIITIFSSYDLYMDVDTNLPIIYSCRF